MKFLPVILFFCFFPLLANSEEINNILSMEETARVEILEKYKSLSNEHLVLVSVSLKDKEKNLNNKSLVFRFIDKSKYDSNKYSRYLYTAYWTKFSLVTGKILNIGTSHNGYFKPIKPEEYYQ